LDAVAPRGEGEVRRREGAGDARRRGAGGDESEERPRELESPAALAAGGVREESGMNRSATSMLGPFVLAVFGGAVRAEDVQPRSRVAKLGEVRVRYDDAGPAEAKEAVVFVHGWACDRTVWRFQMPVLAGRVRCLAVDLPGHGE